MQAAILPSDTTDGTRPPLDGIDAHNQLARPA